MSVIPFPGSAASPAPSQPEPVVHVYRRREVWAVGLCTAEGDDILALALELEDAVVCGRALAQARAVPVVVEDAA